MTDNPTRRLADAFENLRGKRDLASLVALLRLWGLDDLNAAADVLVLVAEHLPPPVCDTCGGTTMVACPGPGDAKTQRERDALGLVSGVDYCYGMHMGHPCPAPFCDHGYLAMPEHLRRVGALWTEVVEAWNGEQTHESVYYAVERVLRQVGAP